MAQEANWERRHSDLQQSIGVFIQHHPHLPLRGTTAGPGPEHLNNSHLEIISLVLNQDENI